jgi:uncharacterized YigZ family protein
MTEYYIPTDLSQAEFVEKRSRFIGQVCPVDTEEEARTFIESVKKEHHDARHNCWCYLLREGNVLRYSDDGEPQGTAGQPMLEMFQREGVTNLVCVVTRYFGGILLGTGGLLRAYTRSAKDALDAAGVSVVRRWVAEEIPCAYNLFDQIRREVLSFDGVVLDTEYGADVRLSVLIPEERQGEFEARLVDVTAGTVRAQVSGEEFRAVPIRLPKEG